MVADVDNDGHADIVVTSDRVGSSSLSNTGVHVLHDVANQWARTRRIWNQHSYHVTNVNEDGSDPERGDAALARAWPEQLPPQWLLRRPQSADRADRFTYQTSDGTLTSNVATVRIAIRAANSGPEITSAPSRRTRRPA